MSNRETTFKTVSFKEFSPQIAAAKAQIQLVDAEVGLMRLGAAGNSVVGI